MDTASRCSLRFPSPGGLRIEIGRGFDRLDLDRSCWRGWSGSEHVRLWTGDADLSGAGPRTCAKASKGLRLARDRLLCDPRSGHVFPIRQRANAIACKLLFWMAAGYGSAPSAWRKGGSDGRRPAAGRRGALTHEELALLLEASIWRRPGPRCTGYNSRRTDLRISYTRE